MISIISLFLMCFDQRFHLPSIHCSSPKEEEVEEEKKKKEDEEKKKKEDEDNVREVKSSSKVYGRTRAETRNRLKKKKTIPAAIAQTIKTIPAPAIAQTINVDPLSRYEDALLNELL